MSKENEETIEVYKEKAYLYLSNSIEHDKLNQKKARQKREHLENLIISSFSSLPNHSKIFEIGCGDGSNAKFIQKLGFQITASDIADDFIKATENQGLEPIKFNVLKDAFSEKYSGVFCWRVFVHFTKEDALNVIQKVYDTLEKNGIFIFNAINREIKDVDNEWVDFEGEYHMGVKRYYSYFSKNDLDNIIQKTNFKIIDFHKDGGTTNNKWLIYVLKK